MTPSEHTVEVMANHFLLEGLADPQAWLACPTTVEERVLGFDASLQGFKRILIQYKRVVYVYADARVRTLISTRQHGTLLAVGGGASYYAVADHATYLDVQADFLSAPPSAYFDRTSYIPATALPFGTTAIRGSFLYGFEAVGLFGVVAVPHYSGPEFVDAIKACSVGVPFVPALVERPGHVEGAQVGALPRLSLLVARMLI